MVEGKNPKISEHLQQHNTSKTANLRSATDDNSLTTFSSSSFLVSSVSPGLSWRVRWCQRSPSRGPSWWRRRCRGLRRTTDDWRHETGSSSGSHWQLRSRGVWLWGNPRTQTAGALVRLRMERYLLCDYVPQILSMCLYYFHAFLPSRTFSCLSQRLSDF